MRRFMVAALAALALPAAAQNVDIEALSGLQFNFGNPGARALAMGGAFLGLADDASAAEANPAGLTILRKPEVSIELRHFIEQQVFTTSGTFPDIERTAFNHHSKSAMLSFASVVYPIRNFTVGAYFHEPLNNEGGGFVAPQRDPFTGAVTPLPHFYMPTERVPGTDEVRFLDAPITAEECDRRRNESNDPFTCQQVFIKPFISVLQVRQRTWGISGAWQVHPRFSVGLTARHQRFLESAATLRYNEFFQLEQTLIQATAEERDGEVQLVEQSDTTFAVGLKWTPMDKLSFGAVYKQGPEFEAPLFYADSANTNNEFIVAANPSFHIPDVAGLGVSYRPIPALTLNADAVRVTYSNLVDDFVASAAGVAELDEPFKADDVTELRFGAEYLFPTKIPVAIRAGYWQDPAHSITWNGPLNRPNFVAEAMLFPKGEDQEHYTLGAGLAWPRFQIDLAYDTSDRYKAGSVSMVARF
ncbi:MAG TPA: outer membrane protein transport protein [Thermoanaerobaculia bacterium]|nr:outer membrane protein transport protein [Thermoanaerobaculia bacterium]